MIYYGEKVSQNIPLPQPLADYHDDPLQMGGNVITDSQGKIIKVFSSRHPADRPQMSEIMGFLQTR